MAFLRRSELERQHVDESVGARRAVAYRAAAVRQLCTTLIACRSRVRLFETECSQSVAIKHTQRWPQLGALRLGWSWCRGVYQVGGGTGTIQNWGFIEILRVSGVAVWSQNDGILMGLVLRLTVSDSVSTAARPFSVVKRWTGGKVERTENGKVRQNENLRMGESKGKGRKGMEEEKKKSGGSYPLNLGVWRPCFI